jgi:hypothetical protein
MARIIKECLAWLCNLKAVLAISLMLKSLLILHLQFISPQMVLCPLSRLYSGLSESFQKGWRSSLPREASHYRLTKYLNLSWLEETLKSSKSLLKLITTRVTLNQYHYQRPISVVLPFKNHKFFKLEISLYCHPPLLSFLNNTSGLVLAAS